MRIRPIQTGCAEIPISTNTMADRSNSDRGRSAERIPIGTAISIQTTAPPNTREAVTGAASFTISVTGWRVAYERPSDGSLKWKPPSKLTGIRPPKKRPYWTITGSSSPICLRTRSTWSGGACGPAMRRAGSAGPRKEMVYGKVGTATKRTHAQRSRRIRYLCTRAAPKESERGSEAYRRFLDFAVSTDKERAPGEAGALSALA